MAVDPTSMKSSLTEYVFDFASAVPDRIALASEYETITYAELEHRIRKLATAFSNLGVSRGDRVALITTPRADAYTIFLALNAIGAIWVGVNPVYQYAEMEYAIKDAKPRLLIFVADFQGREYRHEAEQLKMNCDSVEHIFCLNKSLPKLESVTELVMRFDHISDLELPRGRPEDVAMIVHTSGSTGSPKGAMLSNKAMAFRGLTQYQQYKVKDYPRVYCPLPLNHVGGMQMVAAAALFNGGTVNFREKFDPAEVGKVISACQVNFIVLFPTMYHLICDAPDFDYEDFESLEVINFSGGTISKDLLMRIKKMGSGDVRTCFGSTETCIGVIFSEAGLDPDVLAISVGRPIADDVRVMNKQGQACAPGEVGEFEVLKEYCMTGYFNRPEETTEVFTDDGYIKTGDLVEILPDGNYRFVARISEMFKSGGYNVYPREIEIFLEQDPNIVMAAVAGVPDPLYSEVGYAFLLPAPGTNIDLEQVRSRCKEGLANFKAPKAIQIMEEFPKLPNGKMDKTTLKKMAARAWPSDFIER